MSRRESLMVGSSSNFQNRTFFFKKSAIENRDELDTDGKEKKCLEYTNSDKKVHAYYLQDAPILCNLCCRDVAPIAYNEATKMKICDACLKGGPVDYHKPRTGAHMGGHQAPRAHLGRHRALRALLGRHRAPRAHMGRHRAPPVLFGKASSAPSSYGKASSAPSSFWEGIERSELI